MDASDFLIMPSNLHFDDIRKLDEKNCLAASNLLMDSLPVYYRIDGVDDSEMVAAVALLIGKPGSEIEKGFAAIRGAEVSGIATFLKSESLAHARLIGAQALFKLLSNQSAKHFRNSLKNYNAGFGAVPEDSIYLSRFAVDKNYKGKGLAGLLMDRFLSSIDNEGGKQNKAALHVDRENRRAIAFYSKHGFKIHEAGTRYLTMVCSSNAS